MTITKNAGIYKTIYDNGNNLLLIRKIKMTFSNFIETLITLKKIPPFVKSCTLKLQN